MKKKFVAIGLVILAAILVLAVILIKKSNTVVEPIQTTVATTAAPFKNAQLGITVDSWLKIIEIDEYYGRLAVTVENVSDSDVEHAVLTVKTKNETLTFNVSVLLKGTKATLLCNQDVGCNPNEVYTSWQIKDKILFAKPPVMNADKLEVSVLDGSISIKNISGEDINSDIYIYYKDKDNDKLNGSMTHRSVLRGGLKADSQSYIKPDGFDGKHCQIIFTDYDN